MRKNILLPGLAVAGGVLGFGLRRWQWATAYNPDTQLFLHGSPATYALVTLVAVLTLGFLFLASIAQNVRPVPASLRCPQSGYMALMAAAALLLFGGGVLGLFEGLEQLNLWRMEPSVHLVTYPLASLLCAVLSFVAGGATLLFGKGNYRNTLGPSGSLLVLATPFTALVWLFATHLNHGTDPVFMGYGFPLAATCLLLLAHYYVAAFFHRRPSPGRLTFCALLGTSLGLLSLADSLTPFQSIMTVALSVSALAHVYALLGHVSANSRLDQSGTRMPSGAHREKDVNTDAPRGAEN